MWQRAYEFFDRTYMFVEPPKETFISSNIYCNPKFA